MSTAVGTLTSLLALRYKLVWAHARSRHGRIVMLAAGYCVVVFFAGVFALGGVGAAMASIRTGHARLVAEIVLAVLFLNGGLAAVFLGIGVRPVFSEASLRRYPLSRASRLMTRHGTALLEPLWLIVLIFATSLAVGFSVFGAGMLPAAIPAAVLYTIATYLVACLLMSVGEWTLSRRGGPLTVIVLGVSAMMFVPLAPALVARLAARPDALPALRAWLERSPPYAAAEAMTTRVISSALASDLRLVAWIAGLAMLLILVERLPRQARSGGGAAVRWDHPVDRVAAIFGPVVAPLAGKILRYYLRSPQVRYNFPLALPVVASMVVMNSGGSPAARFLFVLGAAPAVAFLATGTLSMNFFGFDGCGFRRYFLWPIRAGEILRTAALASLMPGALLIPIGCIAWWVLTPAPTGRMAVMVLTASCGGLLFFHALAIWTTILAPRPIPFDMTFGNKLSPAANLLFIAAMGVFFGLPFMLRRWGLEAVLGGWWIAALLFVTSLAFYAVTLRAGGPVLVARKERMLIALEGH